MASRILIIDDEEEFSSALATFLEENQFSAVVIPSLIQARDFLRNEPAPDMILLDVMLKDGNGLIFMNELRKQPHTKNIPVIMMSAVRNTGADRVAGLEFGAYDYLNKPFDFREMVFRIERHLASARQSFVVKQEEIDPGSRKDSVPVPDMENPVNAMPEDHLVLIDLDQPDSSLARSPFVSDWIRLILAPKDFIESVPAEQQKKLGWALVFVTTTGWAIQVGASSRSFGAMLVGALIFSGLISAGVAGMSWVVQWVLGLKNIRIEMTGFMRRMLCGLAPLSVSSWLGVVYVLGARGGAAEFTLGPLLFFPSQISSNTLGYVLRRFDFFEVWSVALIAFFVSRLFPRKRKAVWGWVVVIWTALVFLFGVLRWMFV